jgi:hypothetical protein
MRAWWNKIYSREIVTDRKVLIGVASSRYSWCCRTNHTTLATPLSARGVWRSRGRRRWKRWKRRNNLMSLRDIGEYIETPYCNTRPSSSRLGVLCKPISSHISSDLPTWLADFKPQVGFRCKQDIGLSHTALGLSRPDSSPRRGG